MSNNMYNRLSFRSPLRHTSRMKSEPTSEVKIPISVSPPKPIVKEVRAKPSIYDRTSYRSPKRVVPKIDDSYKVVTKTPSGDFVKVPEPVTKKFSFVRFIEKKIPTPIKQDVITEYIKPGHKKYN